MGDMEKQYMIHIKEFIQTFCFAKNVEIIMDESNLKTNVKTQKENNCKVINIYSCYAIWLCMNEIYPSWFDISIHPAQFETEIFIDIYSLVILAALVSDDKQKHINNILSVSHETQKYIHNVVEHLDKEESDNEEKGLSEQNSKDNTPKIFSLLSSCSGLSNVDQTEELIRIKKENENLRKQIGSNSNEDIKKLENQIDDLKRINEKLEQKFLENKDKEKDNNDEDLQEKYNKSLKDIEDKEKQIEEHQKKIDEQKKLINEKQQKIDEQDKIIDEKQQKLDEKDKIIDEKQQKIDEQEKQFDHKKIEVEEKQKLVEEKLIYNYL
ncbi:hypothetical protein PFFCH_01599 [Plasmodium falciparum FCH/4]|uniref:Uncharacterized protein n=1 Tax=Plasmodium falciparum FCH/4 TaxID=1036724 RepID=A0A024VQH7_PLAFA|nr:hypothetical protein PFFCH_01599 [Plasmodium falciparum FCH/4]